MEKQYLFSITGSPTKHVTRNLNDEKIPKLLRFGFKKEGYYLPDPEDMSIEILPEGWELHDEIEGKIYEIRKENEDLDVYKVEKSEKPKEEEKEADEEKDREKGEEKSEELEWFNKVRVLDSGKKVGIGLLIYISTCFFIIVGLAVFEIPIIILLVPFLLLLGVISLVVGSILGLSSKDGGDAFISGFLTSLLGTMIVLTILIIGGAMEFQGEDIDDGLLEVEDGYIEVDGEIWIRFIFYSIIMGFVGSISGTITNKFLLEAVEKRDSS